LLQSGVLGRKVIVEFSQDELIEKLKSLELPLHENVEAIFSGTCALNSLLEQRVTPAIRGILEHTEYEAAVAGAFYRIAAWLKSLVRLNQPIDIQAVFAGARSIFELTVDIKLLVENPSMAPQFHAFVFVERFRAAKRVVDFVVSSLSGDPSKGKAERELVEDPAQQRKLEGLCRSFGWWDADKCRAKRIDHWSGWDMYTRTKNVGVEYEEVYRVYYPMFSWNVHAGTVGVGGVSARGIESGFGVAHGVVQDLVYDATREVATTFRLFDAVGDLREKLKAVKEVFPRSLLDASIRALEELEKSSNDEGTSSGS